MNRFQTTSLERLRTRNSALGNDEGRGKQLIDIYELVKPIPKPDEFNKKEFLIIDGVWESKPKPIVCKGIEGLLQTIDARLSNLSHSRAKIIMRVFKKDVRIEYEYEFAVYAWQHLNPQRCEAIRREYRNMLLQVSTEEDEIDYEQIKRDKKLRSAYAGYPTQLIYRTPQHGGPAG